MNENTPLDHIEEEHTQLLQPFWLQVGQFFILSALFLLITRGVRFVVSLMFFIRTGEPITGVAILSGVILMATISAFLLLWGINTRKKWAKNGLTLFYIILTISWIFGTFYFMDHGGKYSYHYATSDQMEKAGYWLMVVGIGGVPIFLLVNSIKNKKIKAYFGVS